MCDSAVVISYDLWTNQKVEIMKKYIKVLVGLSLFALISFSCNDVEHVSSEDSTKFLLTSQQSDSVLVEGKPYKYVWAKGGINLRERPSVTSKIVSKVPFGDSLVILSVTKIGLANLLIKADNGKRRLLLQNHWVEVLVNGVKGYMIDGYLLDYRCPKKGESLSNYLDRLAIKSVDEKQDDPFRMDFGIARFECNKRKLPKGQKISFSKLNKPNEIYVDEVALKRNYHGFSTSILIVFLDPFFDILGRDGRKLKVSKNWTNYLNIEDRCGEKIEFMLLNNGSINMDIMIL